VGAAVAVAVGVWWNANTISHLFIHRPFFRRRAANAAFAALLTAMLGFPQSIWRDRHLAHHRGAGYRFRLTPEIVLQGALVLTMWTALASGAPSFFATAYLPGYVLGLLLCAVHGHYEHASGITSHYGRVYNALCFNDGYHLEHHRHPSAAWWTLPRYREAGGRTSAWPAPLRWLEHSARGTLVVLERVVLRSAILQRWVVRTHRRAFEHLLPPDMREIAIVGGGLFPRTAVALRALVPHAHLTIVDANADNLDRARTFLRDDNVTFLQARYPCDAQCDVMVFPLSFDGDRSAVYAQPPAPLVLVHDWIWRRRGASRIVSLFLLKRLNLVTA